MSTNKSTFLNHLADSLNHGIIIPEEEILKFKEDYIPKYFLDWRKIEDPKTKIRYWRNFGKVYPDKDFQKKNGINRNKSNRSFRTFLFEKMLVLSLFIYSYIFSIIKILNKIE